MSSRFHNKWHRHNHHTYPNPNPQYPDSSHDPIASPESPFQGDFVLQGPLSANSSLSGYAGFLTSGNTALILDGETYALSAQGDCLIDGDITVNGDINQQGTFTIDGSAVIQDGLTVFNAIVDNTLTVYGNLSVLGQTTELDTTIIGTSSLILVNPGTGPALSVKQLGSQPILYVIDETTPGNDKYVIAIPDGGKVAIGNLGSSVSEANSKAYKDLTVVGEISGTGNVFFNGATTLGAATTISGLLSTNSSTITRNICATQITTNTLSTLQLTALSGTFTTAAIRDISAVKLITNGLTSKNTIFLNGSAAQLGVSIINETIDGVNSVVLENDGGTVSGIILPSTNNSYYPQNSFILYQNSVPGTAPIIFMIQDTELMRIAADGNVGIGVSTPSEKLTVAGNISASGLYLGSFRYNSVSTNFNAVTDTSYLVNTFGGIVSATLPSTPLTGDTIQFADPFSTWDNNLFVVNRNNNNIENTTENLFCDVGGTRFTLTFVGSSVGWKVYQ